MGIEHGPAIPSARRLRGLVAAILLYLGLAAAPAFACDIATPSTANMGTLSPAAVPSAGFIATRGSFKCATGSVLSLLAADYLRATLLTTGTLTLTATTGGSMTYLLAADQEGTAPITYNVRRSYVEGSTLSLLGNSRADVPIFIKPVSGTAPLAGIYAGSFQIRWAWQFCNGIAVLGACVLADVDQGSKIATVNVTVTVAKNAIVTMTQRTTWEASAATNKPKAIPGAKLRMTLQILNPNPFALDGNTLTFTLPTPAGLRIALDGDGTGTGDVVQAGDASGTTGLKFKYSSPSDPDDDVDFASGNNVWGYKPVAGDSTTQGLVTAVQFNPKGMMAAGTAYTISIPYSVR